MRKKSPHWFSQILLRWDKENNDRLMPWKGEKDPYKVWLSEVILQQTRVDQGIKYYESFIAAFPNVHALANAPEQIIYKLWEGLGYYRRCRNLIDTARHIVTHLNGEFPGRYEEIRKLKVRKRWFNYIVMEYRGKIAIRQRRGKDIWHNLFEFLLIESRPRMSTDAVLKQIKKEGWLGQNGFEVKSVSTIFSQQLSHQRIEGRFTRLKLHRKHRLSNDALWIRKCDIKQFPFPKFVNQYLEQEQSLH